MAADVNDGPVEVVPVKKYKRPKRYDADSPYAVAERQRAARGVISTRRQREVWTPERQEQLVALLLENTRLCIIQRVLGTTRQGIFTAMRKRATGYQDKRSSRSKQHYQRGRNDFDRTNAPWVMAEHAFMDAAFEVRGRINEANTLQFISRLLRRTPAVVVKHLEVLLATKVPKRSPLRQRKQQSTETRADWLIAVVWSGVLKGRWLAWRKAYGL